VKTQCVCAVSLAGAQYCEDFVLSVFLGDDIVPRLSISSAFDLKIRLLTTLHNCDMPKVSCMLCAKCAYLKNIFWFIFSIYRMQRLFRIPVYAVVICFDRDSNRGVARNMIRKGTK